MGYSRETAFYSWTKLHCVEGPTNLGRSIIFPVLDAVDVQVLGSGCERLAAYRCLGTEDVEQAGNCGCYGPGTEARKLKARLNTCLCNRLRTDIYVVDSVICALINFECHSFAMVCEANHYHPIHPLSPTWERERDRDKPTLSKQLLAP
jgi:hypothetical protein